MFYQKTKDGYILRVRLTPNSSCCQTIGQVADEKGEDWLKISVNAVPEKGKANKELLKFLAKILELPKSALSLTSGQADRYKKITIETSYQLEQKLEELLCTQK